MNTTKFVVSILARTKHLRTWLCRKHVLKDCREGDLTSLCTLPSNSAFKSAFCFVSSSLTLIWG